MKKDPGDDSSSRGQISQRAAQVQSTSRDPKTNAPVLDQQASNQRSSSQMPNQNLKKSKINGTLKQLPQPATLTQQKSETSAQNTFQKKKVSQVSNNSGSANNSARKDTNPSKRKINREKTQNFDTMNFSKDKKLTNPQLILMAKQVKLPPDMLEQINEIIQTKIDADISQKIREKSKKRAIELDRLGRHAQSADQLNEQEQKIYKQIVDNQVKQNAFVDVMNIMKVLNEFSQNYFNEAYKVKTSQTTEQNSNLALQIKFLEIFDYDNKLFSFNIEKSLDFLSKNNSEHDVLQLFKMLIRLNSFITLDEIYTNDLEDYNENQKTRFKDLFNVPNEKEHKLLRKINKIRNTLHKLMETDNQLGADFVQFDEARLKKSDIYELLSEPFFKAGVNSISIVQSISTYTSNMQNLTNNESFTLMTDLIKYQLDDSQSLFEDYLCERNKTQPKLVSQPSKRYLMTQQTRRIIPSIVNEIQEKAEEENEDQNPASDQSQLLNMLKNINKNIFKHMGLNENDTQTPLSMTSQNINEANKTNSQLSVSEFPSNESPLDLKKIDNELIDPEAKETSKKALIRRETIKTIKALQDFVRKSTTKKNSFRMKNSTILKINSIKSITSPAQAENKQKSPSKLIRASPGGIDSQASIQINESDQESSSNSTSTLMRYTNGPKSNGSKSTKNSPARLEGKNHTTSKFFQLKKNESFKSQYIQLTFPQTAVGEQSPGKRKDSMKKSVQSSSPLKVEGQIDEEEIGRNTVSRRTSQRKNSKRMIKTKMKHETSLGFDRTFRMKRIFSEEEEEQSSMIKGMRNVSQRARFLDRKREGAIRAIASLDERT